MKNNARKLVLAKTTLVSLTRGRLDHVQGGMMQSWGCQSQLPCSVINTCRCD